MKVTLLPSSIAPGAGVSQYLTTFLVDDRVAVDAGSLGLIGSRETQMRVKHVFLTHSHMDHLATLPIFLENVYEPGGDCPTIHASEPVIDCLRRDVFNGRLWPDFFRLGTPDAPFLRVEPLVSGRAVEVPGLRVTPVAVDHLVPTLGLIVEGPDASVVIAGDTGPTMELWRRAGDLENLRAVFLEAAFPDGLIALADASRHLTPRSLAGEVRKIAPGVSVFAVHLKPRYLARIADELAALGRDAVEVCQPGREYVF